MQTNFHANSVLQKNTNNKLNEIIAMKCSCSMKRSSAMKCLLLFLLGWVEWVLTSDKSYASGLLPTV